MRRSMREIERKFLVVGDEWRKLATGDHFRQGYLNHLEQESLYACDKQDNTRF